MTQLLVSVKNADEAMLALACGVDIIDLKDPDVEALGALGLEDTQQIIRVVGGRVPVSATVGEHHASVDILMDSIQSRLAMNMDIIKISVSDFFYHNDFIEKISHVSLKKVKLVAVFFADAEGDLDFLPNLQQMGFWGAMLDTQNKQKGLLKNWSFTRLQHFVTQCEHCGLRAGLAGSLQPQDVEILSTINATYLGFRGGVCDNSFRGGNLSRIRIEAAKSLLCKHNKLGRKPQPNAYYELHST